MSARINDAPLWRQRIAEAVRPHGQLAALARAAGMTAPQLKKIATGANPRPQIDTLERIANAMGLTLAQLVAEARPEEPIRDAVESHPLLEALLRQLDAAEPVAEDSWRGDVLQAIAVLTRALRRPDAAGPVARTPGAPRR